jgi:hypothetical protein
MNTPATIVLIRDVATPSRDDPTQTDHRHKLGDDGIPCFAMQHRSRGLDTLMGIATVTTYEVRLQTDSCPAVGEQARLSIGDSPPVLCHITAVTGAKFNPLGHTHLTLEKV